MLTLDKSFGWFAFHVVELGGRDFEMATVAPVLVEPGHRDPPEVLAHLVVAHEQACVDTIDGAGASRGEVVEFATDYFLGRGERRGHLVALGLSRRDEVVKPPSFGLQRLNLFHRLELEIFDTSLPLHEHREFVGEALQLARNAARCETPIELLAPNRDRGQFSVTIRDRALELTQASDDAYATPPGIIDHRVEFAAANELRKMSAPMTQRVDSRVDLLYGVQVLERVHVVLVVDAAVVVVVGGTVVEVVVVAGSVVVGATVVGGGVVGGAVVVGGGGGPAAHG